MSRCLHPMIEDEPPRCLDCGAWVCTRCRIALREPVGLCGCCADAEAATRLTAHFADIHAADRIAEVTALLPTDSSVCLTEDGGVTLEIENAVTGRDVLIAFSADGAEFFLVKEGNTFRHAGRVKSIAMLVRWVAGSTETFQ